MSKEEMIPKVRFENYSKNKAWEEFKLGELVTIKSGASPAAFKYGEELYVKVDDLNYSFKYQNDTNMKVAENLRYKKTKKGSVIFPKRGAAIMTNKVRIMGISGYMDTNMMALEPEGITTEFLYLSISKTGLYKIADTSTIPQINNKHIEPYKIIIPEENEQQKIGNLFEKLDQAISLQQQVLEATKDYKQSMLQKMFPKKDEEVPGIRINKFNFIWEKTKLNNYLIKNNEKNKQEKINNVESINNIYGFISQTEQFGHSVASKNLSNYYIIKPRMFAYNPSRLNVGSIAYKNDKDISVVSPLYISFKLKANIDDYFFWYWLKTQDFERQRKAFSQGSVRDTLDFDSFASINIKLPILEEQQKIGSFFKTLDEKIEQEEKKLEAYESMKKALMQRMFV